MRNPFLSPSAAKKLLEKLQREKTEATNIDAKETLNLKQDGDRATFIRHIAALANTGKKSYLLIGVEDKTWILKGIPEDSLLQTVDVVQQQMNQILANRLDPPVLIRYRVHNIDGESMGVVEIEGKNPPHIVSIEAERYGGGKTEGKNSYIQRGVVYKRRGTDSIPVNRQNEIVDMFNLKRDWLEIIITLVFIGAIIGAGVGIGVSSIVVWFIDPVIAAFLGGAWGVFVGGIFNSRLANAIGTFPAGCINRCIKSFGGMLWGGVIGSYLSFAVVGSILSGETMVYDLLSMSLCFIPITAVGFIINFFLLVFIARQIQKAYKRGTIF